MSRHVYYANGWQYDTVAPASVSRVVHAPVYGELVITANSGSGADTLTLTEQDIWYPVIDGWSVDKYSHVTLDAVNGRMTAQVTGEYATICTVAFTSEEEPQTIEFGIFRDGALIPDHLAVTWLDTTTFPNTITISGIDDVAKGQVLDLRVHCTTAAGQVMTITDVNFSVFALGNAA